jgi:hydrogenase expression/formation protein HypD
MEAHRDGIENFSVLMCHKTVVPAMLALLEAEDLPLDGFLCPGHVSVIIGARAYVPIVRKHAKPCVVAGFEAGQILTGLVHLVRQIAQGEAALQNVYSAVVSPAGNQVAQKLLDEVLTTVDAVWRKLGTIPLSGQELAPAYRQYDALERFGIVVGEDEDHPDCRCGEVIQGRVEPPECALFGTTCTPLSPVGPCMVSSEGTCAAWYKYNRTPGGETRATAPRA